MSDVSGHGSYSAVIDLISDILSTAEALLQLNGTCPAVGVGLRVPDGSGTLTLDVVLLGIAQSDDEGSCPPQPVRLLELRIAALSSGGTRLALLAPPELEHEALPGWAVRAYAQQAAQIDEFWEQLFARLAYLEDRGETAVTPEVRAGMRALYEAVVEWAETDMAWWPGSACAASAFLREVMSSPLGPDTAVHFALLVAEGVNALADEFDATTQLCMWRILMDLPVHAALHGLMTAARKARVSPDLDTPDVVSGVAKPAGAKRERPASPRALRDLAEKAGVSVEEFLLWHDIRSGCQAAAWRLVGRYKPILQQEAHRWFDEKGGKTDRAYKEEDYLDLAQLAAFANVIGHTPESAEMAAAAQRGELDPTARAAILAPDKARSKWAFYRDTPFVDAVRTVAEEVREDIEEGRLVVPRSATEEEALLIAPGVQELVLYQNDKRLAGYTSYLLGYIVPGVGVAHDFEANEGRINPFKGNVEAAIRTRVRQAFRKQYEHKSRSVVHQGQRIDQVKRASSYEEIEAEEWLPDPGSTMDDLPGHIDAARRYWALVERLSDFERDHVESMVGKSSHGEIAADLAARLDRPVSEDGSRQALRRILRKAEDLPP